MAQRFFFTKNRNPLVFRMTLVKDQVEKVEIDFSGWASANENVTGATWSVKSGDCSVANEAISSNVASGEITADDVGPCLIEIKGSVSGNLVPIAHVHVRVREPESIVNDYGFLVEG